MSKLIINGKEFKQYSELENLIKKIEQYFIDTTEYSGYPTLPEFWLKIDDIFNNTDCDDEKRMMFFMIYLKLLEAYRHWTFDKDALWRDKDIENHKNFIEKHNLVWKKDERNWNKFW